MQTDAYVFDVSALFTLLLDQLSRVVTWAQTHSVGIYGHRVSFFHLALGGMIIYTVLSVLPIWDSFPEPYHSEFEDEEGFDD